MPNTLSQLQQFRARAEGTNVNAVTLLATDYLNHFNEALMLAELLVDMPDMIEDFAAWSPKPYKDHFRESGIADRELALEAYDVSPQEYRQGFDATVEELNEEILDLQKLFLEAGETEETSPPGDLVEETCSHLRLLIDKAGSIINGQEILCCDSFKLAAEATGATLEQNDIDALFD